MLPSSSVLSSRATGQDSMFHVITDSPLVKRSKVTVSETLTVLLLPSGRKNYPMYKPRAESERPSPPPTETRNLPPRPKRDKKHKAPV
ncbi:hypothetical protein AMELA_G00085980 [Ameiurus melas]|uniref:Uncharacterized protein n=1 Tax=Ameiurus melas TaxID=219545 RepID=A0A7J6AVC6_AMEME|nr:hypothetical protein AMELA_G00085980 [Ameiurus melas]